MAEAAHKVALEKDEMPWCEWCQCYHGPQAEHIEKSFRLADGTDFRVKPQPEKAVKPPRGKRIQDHTADELDAAIDHAVKHCAEHGLQFFKILHGIDAYMERRKRGAPIRSAGLDDGPDYDNESMWGSS